MRLIHLSLMNIFESIHLLQDFLNNADNQKKTIGFVPTMGALHQGHISLIECSKRSTELTVASIFVNSTQFNNPSDLQNYPRTLDSDLQKLDQAGCDCVFVPTDMEMYPNAASRENIFDFGRLATVMEGAFRPGHFDGVGIIVSKLLEIVKPNKAFFGQKDFQQLTIIRYMTEKYLTHLPSEIIGCDIIRENDGLAMSSRNVRLSSEHRKNAPLIYQILSEIAQRKNNYSVKEIKQWVSDEINKNPYLEVEYFDIVENKSLNSIKQWNEENIKVACIAVFAGDVRLIDNFQL